MTYIDAILEFAKTLDDLTYLFEIHLYNSKEYLLNFDKLIAEYEEIF